MIHWNQYLPKVIEILDAFVDDGRNNECLISKNVTYNHILITQKEKLIRVCECFGTSDE